MKDNKNTLINNKGFTLIEIIAVVIIIGILVTVGGISVTSYIIKSKNTTYESYKKDLKGASENYFIDCMTNNEEGCEIPLPQPGNSERITYDTLVRNGYTEELKDPDGEGYCDQSYVIATNTGDSGVKIDYQVCLICSNYQSEEDGCEEIHDTVPPTCGEIKGESTEWTNENKVISVKCKDNGGAGCKKNEFSKSLGKEGEVVTTGNITIEDKSGNKTSCPVNVYVDRKAPTCKIELNKDPSNGWYKAGSVTASIIDIEDEGSGVALSGMGTSLVNREYNGNTKYKVTKGIVTVFGYVKDKAGNEGYCSQEVKVDTTKPTGVIYMGYEIYPRENTTINTNTIRISNLTRYGQIDGIIVYFKEKLDKSITSDVSVVTEGNIYSIKESGGFTTGKKRGVIKTQGVYSDTLEIQLGSSSDGSKYTQQIEKIELIKKEDTTSVWTNKDVTVYVDAKDTLSGVRSYSYNGGSRYTTSNVNTYSENTSYYVKIRDQAGNLSEKYYFTINKIDKTAPDLSIEAYACTVWGEGKKDECYNNKTERLGGSSTPNDTIEIDWINKASVFDYIVDEAHFDYVKWEYSDTYKYEKTDLINVANYEEQDYYTWLWGQGYRVAKLTAYDLAGNSTSINVEVKIDRQKPECELDVTSGTLSPSGWYVSDVRIGFKKHIDSGGSNVDIYGIDGYTSTSVTLKEDTTSSGITYTGYIKDKAGNENTCTLNVKRDTVAPKLTVKAYKCSDTTSRTACHNSKINTLISSSTRNNPVVIDWTNQAGLFEYTVGEANDYNVEWEYNTAGSATKTDLSSKKTYDNTNSYVTLTAEGYRVGKITVYDLAGNSTSINVEVKIDRQKPTCTLKVTSGTENNGWYTTNVGIGFNIHSDEGGSGVLTYGIGGYTSSQTETLTTDTAGQKYTGYIKDKAGNTNTCEITVKRDTTAPTLTVNAYKCSDSSSGSACHSNKSSTLEDSSSTNGDTVMIGWTNQSGDFVYSVTESNFDGMEFKWNDGSSNDLSNTSTGTSKTSYFTLRGEGKRKGQIIAKDKAGNSTTINVAINIDRKNPTAPTVALVNGSWEERQNDTWYNHNIYVSGGTSSSNAQPSSTDPGDSGIAKYQISKDNNTWVDWSYSSTSDYYKIDDAGTTRRYVRAIDNAGNISGVTTKTIKIDRTAPSCTLKVTSGTEGDNDWYISDVGIGFDTHTDTGGSGVSTYGIGDYTSSKTATLTSDTSSQKYTGYIKDGAGNTSQCTITVKRDATKPTLTVNAYKCSDSSSGSACHSNKSSVLEDSSSTDGDTVMIGWTNQSGDFVYSVTESNFDGMEFKWNDGSSNDLSNTDTGTSKTSYFTLRAAGERKGQIIAKDKAGNSTSINVEVKIDRTKPTCKLKVTSGTEGDNDWYTSNVVIGFDTYGDTGGSGVYDRGINGYTSITATQTGNTKGTTYTGKIKDKAGNEETCTITVKKDDTTPRMITDTIGTCTPNSGYTICRSFDFDDTFSEYLILHRAHCAVPTLDDQTGTKNYCVSGFSAYDRVNYHFKQNPAPNSQACKEGDNKCKTDPIYYGTSGTREMNTSFNTANDIQYAFIVCDQAGNCSKVYEYKYECLDDSNYTCRGSTSTKYITQKSVS